MQHSPIGKQRATPTPWGTITPVGIVAIGVYAVARVYICKNRAEKKQQEFYPNNSNAGQKGDAFRHVYVSMLLKRYLTEVTSYLVMDVYWESQGENKPCDKYMDLHNNYIGRHTKYSAFRGKWLADMHAWERWGTRVKDFINNSNNATKMNWNEKTSESTVKNEKNNSSKSKYIYWKP